MAPKRTVTHNVHACVRIRACARVCACTRTRVRGARAHGARELRVVHVGACGCVCVCVCVCVCACVCALERIF